MALPIRAGSFTEKAAAALATGMATVRGLKVRVGGLEGEVRPLTFRAGEHGVAPRHAGEVLDRSGAALPRGDLATKYLASSAYDRVASVVDGVTAIGHQLNLAERIRARRGGVSELGEG